MNSNNELEQPSVCVCVCVYAGVFNTKPIYCIHTFHQKSAKKLP